MTYAFYYDAPGTPQMYEMVSRELAAERPEGLVLHLVTRTERGLRHLNVWQSRQQWETFRDRKVRPAVATVLTRMGVPIPDGPPEEVELDLVDVGPLQPA
jgi:hypothetical protein